MQYGHCVVSATATAINSLYFTGIAPSATAALSKAQKAFITCGARLSIFLSLARCCLLYIFGFPGWSPHSAISQSKGIVVIRQHFRTWRFLQFRVAMVSRYSAATSVVPGVRAILLTV